MGTFATLLALVLGLAFAAAGATKLAGSPPHPEDFERYGLPGATPVTARLAVGAAECVAALLLLLGAVTGTAGLAIAGAALVLMAMAGALATHARLGDPAVRMLPAGVLLALAALVVAVA